MIFHFNGMKEKRGHRKENKAQRRTGQGHIDLFIFTRFQPFKVSRMKAFDGYNLLPMTRPVGADLCVRYSVISAPSPGQSEATPWVKWTFLHAP